MTLSLQQYAFLRPHKANQCFPSAEVEFGFPDDAPRGTKRRTREGNSFHV